jgi:hypothetical protein
LIIGRFDLGEVIKQWVRHGSYTTRGGSGDPRVWI